MLKDHEKAVTDFLSYIQAVRPEVEDEDMLRLFIGDGSLSGLLQLCARTKRKVLTFACYRYQLRHYIRGLHPAEHSRGAAKDRSTCHAAGRVHPR